MSKVKNNIRREIFDFRNAEYQKKFTDLTEDCQELRTCFTGDKSPKSKSANFFKILDNKFHRSFKKIRIRKGNTFKCNNDEDKLLTSRTKLLHAASVSSTAGSKSLINQKVQLAEIEISRILADKNAKLVTSQLEQIDTLDGSFNQTGMWNIKKRIFPRQKEVPTAKYDPFGNLITGGLALKKLYLRTYKDRLEHRPIREKFADIKILKEELWALRFEKLRKCKTNAWTIKEIEEATKTLKNNQTRDPQGLISEIFKPGVAGTDLKNAIVDLMNMILDTMYIPEELLKADITSIWKKKGSRMELSNDRGIFILSILRKIMDKVLYAHFYPSLDTAMSDSNIGARKKRNVRNHLFMVYGIINDVVRNGIEQVDILIYDLVQAFDSLWLHDCLNDIYDLLPDSKRDRKLALVYQTNRHNLVAVNTPVGLTERIDTPEIVQQGGGWGPIECSVSIDKIGRLSVKNEKYQYFYKKKVKTIPLAMVDDLLAVASCGLESMALNAFIVTQIELKKLKFHTTDKKGRSKCNKLHIGKKDDFCPKLFIHGEKMGTSKAEMYLGDILSADGSNKPNIENRLAKGRGKIAEIMGMIEKISLGKHYFKIALLLRNSIFISSILTNAEVWYHISKAEYNDLEALDRQLLKRICKLPSSAPSAALYLETGAIRISSIIMARRANYLHYLAKLPQNEMLSKFFRCQWFENKEFDWCHQVKSDLQKLNLPSELSLIETKSSFQWKSLVRKQVKAYELKDLIAAKNQLSKLSNIEYDKLSTQSYLLEYEAKRAQMVLRYRIRMSKYKGNFRG